MPYIMNDRPPPKLTPWFPGSVKPVRKGVYMLRSGTGRVVGYQYWNGKHWGYWCDTVEEAAASKGCGYAATEFQNDAWRGLAQEPKP